MQIMVTNGGTHPADKWADVTVNEILALVQIADDSNTPEAAAARQAKRDLAPKLVAAFTTMHEATQASERKALGKKGLARLAEPHQVLDHMDEGVEIVTSLMADTPFAAHFQKPEVQQIIGQIIGQHSTDILHIEREHHKTSQA